MKLHHRGGLALLALASLAACKTSGSTSRPDARTSDSATSTVTKIETKVATETRIATSDTKTAAMTATAPQTFTVAQTVTAVQTQPTETHRDAGIIDAPIKPDASINVSNARSPLGYNLDFPGDWSNLIPFINLMDDSREWAGQCPTNDSSCDPVAHLDLDAQGWPRSLKYKDDPTRSYRAIETVFSTVTVGPAIGQTYVITWEGDGTLSWFGINPQGNQANRRLTFVFDGAGPKYIRVASTDPNGTGNNVRNIKIFRQAHETLLAGGERFNPDALEYLKPFGSIRFMDWMESNEKEDRDATWADRARPDYHTLIRQFANPATPNATHTMNGYPVEVLVALANRTGADPHFNMPYRFTDDYVRRFATVVHDTLAPNLRASVEYSNEVWNFSFPQGQYANTQGRALWPNEGSAWVQFMGSRASRMCQIWKEVYSDHPERLRCLFGVQTGWAEMGAPALDCPLWVARDPTKNKPCSSYSDAIAITGYFSGNLAESQNATVIKGWLAQGRDFAFTQALRQLEFGDVAGLTSGGKAITNGGDSLTHTLAEWDAFVKLAKDRSLDLYVYEGGTSMGYNGSDTDVRQFLIDLAHQPKIKDMYTTLFNTWKAKGGTVFNVWGWIDSKSSWANVDMLGKFDHPKYQAIVDFVSKSPCWWDNCDRSQR
jgi:hypothetical protein